MEHPFVRIISLTVGFLTTLRTHTAWEFLPIFYGLIAMLVSVTLLKILFTPEDTVKARAQWAKNIGKIDGFNALKASLLSTALAFCIGALVYKFGFSKEFGFIVGSFVYVISCAKIRMQYKMP